MDKKFEKCHISYLAVGLLTVSLTIRSSASSPVRLVRNFHKLQDCQTLERIYDFQFMYIILFLVAYLTYFMKPVKETTFSSKIHEVFFANIRNDCVFSVIKK